MILRQSKMPVMIILIWIFSLSLPAQDNQSAKMVSCFDRKLSSGQDSSVVLTEEQLIAMALMNSYKLQSMQTNIDIAEYRYRSSGRLDNPELRYRDISLSEREKKYKDQQIGLRFSIPKPGELKEERQGSKVRLWDKKVDKERYQQKLAARIRRDVADIIMYDQLLDLAAKRVAIEDRRIEIVEKMVEIGQRSVVYFTKAKMWHAESKNDYARAKQYRIQARSKLSKHTGVDPDVAIMWPEIPEISCDLADLITIALQNRPEIERLNQRIELAGYQNRLERLKVLPWFNYIEMNYHFEREQRVDWLELMMGISIPLLDWNRGNRQATDLAIRKKELEYNALRETIGDEVSMAYEIYQNLLLDWKNFQRDAQELISEATTVVTQAHAHNTLLPDEVLEMELTIVDTQKLLAQKRRNLAHAFIDLQYAVGTEEFKLPANPETDGLP